MNKILTLKEVKEQNLVHYIHDNGDYHYETAQYSYLIRKGVCVLQIILEDYARSLKL